MALVSTSIPNLINGVSQQPPSVRLPSQAELQENALSSVSSGLQKRPPTEHKGLPLEGLTSQQQADMGSCFFHTIRNSDNTIRILCIQKDGTMSTFDTKGNADTGNVVSNSAQDYIKGLNNPSKDLTAITVADFTFLVNKRKKVEKDSVKSPVRNPEGLVYVAKSDYGVTYDVSIIKNGISYQRRITTMSSSQNSNSGTQNAELSVQTNRIASSLRINTTTDSTYYGHSPARSIPGVTITLHDNVIHYQGVTPNDDFDIKVTDSRANTHLRAFKGETPDFKKLPPNAPDGFTIKVSGDNQKNQDDYYVKYEKDGDKGQFIWKETVKPGIPIGLDSSTMPHVVKFNGVNGYTFKPQTYNTRKVGDDITNPYPSFVGKTVNDVFFHKNRLGFLSGENVIFSQSSEFFNFFASTALIGVDSAPIDVAISNNQTSILEHAVPFNETLLLFSKFTQFKLGATALLTPETISIDTVTQFEVSLDAKPVSTGKYVYFPTQRGVFSGMHEYFSNGEAETNDAIEITGHVPKYIKGVVTNIKASSNENMMIIQTDHDATKIYVYRYFWSGKEKLQSAWSSWNFSGKVRYFDFDNSKVHFIVQYGDTLAFESMNLSEDTALVDTTFPILLDRRVQLTKKHLTPFAGSSTSLPFKNTVDTSSLIFVDKGGTLMNAEAASTAVSNDGIVYTGVPYTFKYQFSEYIMKKDNKPITTGYMSIRNMSLVYSETGFFKVNITGDKNVNGTKNSVLFTGRIIGDGENILGAISLDTGTFTYGVHAISKNVLIEIENDSHLPCSFQTVEVEVLYNLRSRRL